MMIAINGHKKMATVHCSHASFILHHVAKVSILNGKWLTFSLLFRVTSVAVKPQRHRKRVPTNMASTRGLYYTVSINNGITRKDMRSTL